MAKEVIILVSSIRDEARWHLTILYQHGSWSCGYMRYIYIFRSGNITYAQPMDLYSLLKQILGSYQCAYSIVSQQMSLYSRQAPLNFITVQGSSFLLPCAYHRGVTANTNMSMIIYYIVLRSHLDIKIEFNESFSHILKFHS